MKKVIVILVLALLIPIVLSQPLPPPPPEYGEPMPPPPPPPEPEYQPPPSEGEYVPPTQPSSEPQVEGPGEMPPATIPSPDTSEEMPSSIAGLPEEPGIHPMSAPMEEVEQPRGVAPLAATTGSMIYIWYWGRWSLGPASVCLGARRPLAIYIATPGYYTLYEYYYYPGSSWPYRVVPLNLGYRTSGWYMLWFIADTLGWHALVIRSSSGSWYNSNILWVYVTSCGPVPPPRPCACSVSLWIPQTWYPAGTNVIVQYTLNGQARVLRFSVTGPWTYITKTKVPASPGTYSHTFVIGRGTYTVTVEATCNDGCVARDTRTITGT